MDKELQIVIIIGLLVAAVIIVAVSAAASYWVEVRDMHPHDRLRRQINRRRRYR